jgi:hypothetical protein
MVLTESPNTISTGITITGKAYRMLIPGYAGQTVSRFAGLVQKFPLGLVAEGRGIDDEQ